MRHVFRLTFKEIGSKRIMQLGLVFTLLYLGIIVLGEHYAVKDMSPGQGAVMSMVGYQFICLGWYISTLIIGILCIIMGSGSLSREIESGTILGLASRPIGRGSILAGKLLAYLMVIGIYSFLLLLAIVLISSYFFKMPLATWLLLQGIGIFMLYPIVLLVITFFFSASMSTLAAGVSCFMLLAVAIIGGFIEQIAAIMGNHNLVNIGVLASLIMPVDSVYRMAISAASSSLALGTINGFNPFGAASIPSYWMLVYAAVYSMIALTLAWNKFTNRDL